VAAEILRVVLWSHAQFLAFLLHVGKAINILPENLFHLYTREEITKAIYCPVAGLERFQRQREALKRIHLIGDLTESHLMARQTGQTCSHSLAMILRFWQCLIECRFLLAFLLVKMASFGDMVFSLALYASKREEYLPYDIWHEILPGK